MDPDAAKAALRERGVAEESDMSAEPQPVRAGAFCHSCRLLTVTQPAGGFYVLFDRTGLVGVQRYHDIGVTGIEFDAGRNLCTDEPFVRVQAFPSWTWSGVRLFVDGEEAGEFDYPHSINLFLSAGRHEFRVVVPDRQPSVQVLEIPSSEGLFEITF